MTNRKIDDVMNDLVANVQLTKYNVLYTFETIDGLWALVERRIINDQSVTKDDFIITVNYKDGNFVTLNNREYTNTELYQLLMDSEVFINSERMLELYPMIIKQLLEIQAIMWINGLEIDFLEFELSKVIDDFYFETIGEERIEQWERKFQLTPEQSSTLEMRRNAIIARRRGIGKLNSKVIESIVNAFTNGKATSKFKNGVIEVKILPPRSNTNFRFPDVEVELKRRQPAHLGMSVVRFYSDWSEIKNDFTTWDDVKNSFPNWDAVRVYVSPSLYE